MTNQVPWLKKFLYLGCALLLTTLIFVGCKNTASGGTSNDETVYNQSNYDAYTTFEIYTVAQLKQIAALANDTTNPRTFEGRTVKLMNDINGVGSFDGISSVRNNSGGDYKFSGIFDGNNKTVSEYVIYVTTQRHTGLIGAIDTKAIVKNLTVKRGSVTNTAVYDPVKGHFTGSIVGQNYGIITNCINESVEVKGNDGLGGISGRNNNTIEFCTNKATITSIYTGTERGFYCGGIVGFNSATDNTTHITDIALVKYSKNTGTINGFRIVGGIAGIVNHRSNGEVANIENGVIEFCYNTGSVTGKSIVGGIAGNLSDSDVDATVGSFIRNSYNSGTITITGSDAAGYGGGIAGSIGNIGTIKNCYNIGSLNGTLTGGILGYNNSSKGRVVNSYFVNANLKGINNNYGNGEDSSLKLTSAQFETSSNFSGWDFLNVWEIKSVLTTINGVTKRPVLKGIGEGI